MSCDLTEADIEAGLRVKSEQLNADDLIGRDIIAKIVRITPGSAEQAWQIWLEGHKVPWLPCKTMRKLMTAAWGKPTQAWIGRRVHLYRDPETKWAGEAVGGIRLRAMSDIPAAGFSVKLNETKKTKVTVEVALLRVAPVTLAARLNQLVRAGTCTAEQVKAALGGRPAADVPEAEHAAILQRLQAVQQTVPDADVGAAGGEE